MGNRFNEIMQKLRAQRLRARRYTAMLLVLAMLTSLSVSWRLHQVGTALTTDNEYYCGMEEHVHTDECYTEELVCGYEEGEPEEPDSAFSVDPEPTTEEPEAEPEEPEVTEPEVHHHTADCYETVLVEHEVLTCGQEEHAHDDDCTIGDDGEFLCGHEEHTHTDECYTTETETEEKLICGYEEGEVLSDGAADDDGIAALEDTNTAASVAEDDSSSEAVSEPVLHHHTEACYEKVLTCTIPEHTHTLACLADYSADVETDDDWEKYRVGQSDNWNEALLTVAQEQLGYKESEKNFQTDEALGDIIDAHHYTRYGAFYGNPYADWDVAFIAFCQHYAGIPKTEIPQRLGLEALRADMDTMGFAYLVEGEDAAYEAIPGDVVTYNKNGNADDETIGIVETVGVDSLTVISGAVEGAVAEVTVPFTDVTSTILVDQAYSDYVGEPDDPDADEDPDADPDEDADGSYDEEVKARPAMRKVMAVYASEDDNTIVLKDEWLTRVTLIKNGTYTQGDQLELNDGDQIRLRYECTIPKDTLNENCRTLQYHLPDGLKIESDITVPIKNPNDEHDEIGTCTIKADGTVLLTFDANKVHDDVDLPGKFELAATVDASKTGESGSINLPITGPTVTVKKNRDVGIYKKATSIKAENGKATIHYEVEISSTNGWDGELVIKDTLNASTNSDVIKGAYVDGSFKLTDKNGDPVKDKSGEPITVEFTEKTDQTFTTKNLADKLGKLQPGDKYILSYNVEVKDTDIKKEDGSGRVINQVELNGNKQNETSTWFGKRVEKLKGEYDAVNKRMKWTVKVYNPYGGSLGGTKVEDELTTPGAEIISNITIKKENAEGGWNDSFDTIAQNSLVNKTKFSYTFGNDEHGKTYIFEYYTSIPNDKDTINNKVTETTPEGNKFTDSNDGNVTHRTESAWKTKANGKIENGKSSWNLGITFSDGAWSSVEYTDTIHDVIGDKTYTDSHYGIASELQQDITSKLKFVYIDGTEATLADAKTAGVDVTITYYDKDGKAIASTDDTVHIKSFSIKVTKKSDYSGKELKEMKVESYWTHVDASEASSGETIHIKNVFGESTAEFQERKPSDDTSLEKKVSNTGNKWGKGADDYSTYKDEDTITYVDGKSCYLYYAIRVGIEQITQDEIVIKDTLPDGLTLVTDDENYPSAQWIKDSYHSGTWANDVYVPSHIRAEQNGREVTLTLFGLTTDEGNHKTIAGAFTGTDGKGFIIYYKVKVDDAEFANDTNKPFKIYRNTATWNGHTVFADATVKRKNTTVLTKTGVQLEQKNRIQYQVKINPDGISLTGGKSNTVQFTDWLKVKTQGHDVTLVEDSLKLYQYMPDGSLSQINDTTDYNVKITKSTDGGKNTTAIEMTLKDGQGYMLEYQYDTDDPYSDVKVYNEAKIAEDWDTYTETTLTKLQASAEFGNAKLKVYKVDAQSNMVKLAGAQFGLAVFDPTNGWPTSVTMSQVTDASGCIEYAVKANGEGETLKPNTLYRITEEQNPDGYKKSDEKYYFIWLSEGKEVNDQNCQEAYNAAVGAGTAMAEVTWDQVTYFRYGAKATINVPNERNGLVIQKKWENKDGTEMTNPPVDEITLELWKYRADGNISQATKDSDFVLRSQNGWKVELSNLDPEWRYFVKEPSNEKLKDFEVDYGFNNEGRLTGTITITNRSTTDSPGYELPATGSTGTAPHTTAGAVLMAAALVGGYRRKRRQERRGE